MIALEYIASRRREILVRMTNVPEIKKVSERGYQSIPADLRMLS